ncbi:hypothetical protein KPL74_19020 [Bacillus sp. NP157]|nr:hypothetical protein KPL74_19020 [Bacillus sp. NP157]
MFATVFVMAVVSGVIVNLIYEFDFSERSLRLLFTLAFLAGVKTGFVCFLLGIFNVYWKIGSKARGRGCDLARSLGRDRQIERFEKAQPNDGASK